MRDEGRQERRVPNLRRLRTAQGWTRDHLAEQLPPSRTGAHLNVRTLDRWETGESAIPERYWQLLADLFGVSISHLLAWENGPSNGGLKQAA